MPPALMPSSYLGGGRIPKSDPMEGHLQDMLRYNMEKYAGRALDTVGMARRVRELLSIHNIGQRLFAKYVLGLSQGTVSELLSKPKSWEKLTEKGRDSYRKMHAWCYDENAILLLKSLIPKKGEISSSRTPVPPPRAPFMPSPHMPLPGHLPPRPPGVPKDGPFGGGPRMLFPHMDKRPEPPKTKSPISATGASDRSDSPLSKLRDEGPAGGPGGAMKDAIQRLVSFPGLGGFMGKSAEEMQRAVEIYQQELTRLQQQMAAAAKKDGESGGGGDDDLAAPGDRKTPELKLDPKFPFPGFPPVSVGAGSPVPKSDDLKQQPLPAAMPPGPPPPPPVAPLLPPSGKAGEASPLQGMASITNSLTSQPIPPPYRPTQRSYKAVLPPITQEQFDKYDNINTEELVRKVR